MLHKHFLRGGITEDFVLSEATFKKKLLLFPVQCKVKNIRVKFAAVLKNLMNISFCWSLFEIAPMLLLKLRHITDCIYDCMFVFIYFLKYF